MFAVMMANHKGGCGKTTLAHHLAIRAAERGLRVLAVDTDRQSDFYRRLVTDEGNTAECPPVEWREGCLVVYSPDTYQWPAQGQYDLAVIDTPPKNELPAGPSPQLLLIPVDGVDAARNSNETVAEALERQISAIIVFNGIEEGGKRHARRFEAVKDALPKGITVLPEVIPRGGGIKRTAVTCRPAWQDVWHGKDVETILRICDTLITVVLEHARSQTANQARAAKRTRS